MPRCGAGVAALDERGKLRLHAAVGCSWTSHFYSDATKDSGVILDVDATQDLGFPESKNRDYFLGSL
jgi:hypothetical protein